MTISNIELTELEITAHKKKGWFLVRMWIAYIRTFKVLPKVLSK